MTSQTIYIPPKDTAKAIRQALKAAFPRTKFSVRLSAGGSVNVEWTDGPTEEAVRSVAGYYAGATFDGSIDLKELIYREEGPDRVHYGIDFVLLERVISPRALERVVADLRTRFGWTHPITWENTVFGARFTSPAVYLDTHWRWDHEVIWDAVRAQSFEDPPAETTTQALTWRRNPRHHGLEVLGHPDEYTRTILKENGFRWHAKNRYWYAPETPDRLAIVQTLGQEEIQ